MRLRTTAILGALIVASCFAAPKALANPVCGNHKLVTDNLQQTYSETPVSIGVTVSGSVVEVYASPQGTWTMLITQPDGLSCLIAAGKDWENLPKLTKGAHI